MSAEHTHDDCANDSTVAGPDIERLLEAVQSFGAQPDHAALLEKVAEAVRGLLPCDGASVIEQQAHVAAGEQPDPAVPLRSALLSAGLAARKPIALQARQIEGASAAPHVETWAVAPLPEGAAPRAVVAAWRTPREPRAHELQTLGVIARWAAAAIDLRDRRAAVESSLQASEDFVAAAAHELRTPLTPLRLTVDRAARALRAASDPDRARCALDHVDEHLRRMTHIVDTLLEASRIARGDLVLVRRDTDLAALVRDVLARHAEAARRLGCELRVRLQERIVGRWDGQRLREAIGQLVANAIKFGRGAPVVVELSRKGGLARVAVRDRGCGVHAEDRARIFARFERAVSVRNYGGLGVGLWLAREIAVAHGGDVLLESAGGEGASFALELPVHRFVAAPAAFSSGL